MSDGDLLEGLLRICAAFERIAEALEAENLPREIMHGSCGVPFEVSLGGRSDGVEPPF